MEYIINEKRPITFEDPEFKNLMSEIMSQSEAIKKRKTMSEESFRDWLCDIIAVLADRLGFVVQNLKEIPMDMLYSFNKGFNAGRERAKQKSYRNRNR